MGNGQRVERTVSFLIACGVCGFLCSFDEARSEEVVIPLLADPVFPGEAPILTPSLFEPILPPGVPPPSLETSLVETGVWPFHLPAGKEVAVQRLEGRFLLGKRVFGFVHHPEAMLSLRTSRRFRDYIENTESSPRFLTNEEKIDRSFEFAESITDSVQQIPFLGDFLTGCLAVGRDVERVHRKVRTKYHLHLKYSDSTYLATFKESF